MKSAIFHSVRDGDAEITFSYNKPKKCIMIYIEDHLNNTFMQASIDEEVFAKLTVVIGTEVGYEEGRERREAEDETS